MAPFDILGIMGKFPGYLVYFAIGMGFGAVLEMSGFGDSRRLAAQFYLKEMRVLKVMFTAIIVAMLLVFLCSGIGILDFDRLWVNETFLWSQILGGLIMGVGFIVGGFCPGTSLVGASTLKLDGVFFVLGVTFGVFLFGESFPLAEELYYSGDMGRFILPELFGLKTGVMVFLVIVMALTMFFWAEVSERIFGAGVAWKELSLRPDRIMNLKAAGALVAVALAVLVIGQPDLERRWSRLPEIEKKKLSAREVYIHPYELRDLMNDPAIYTRVLDVRPESQYNLFHIRGARMVSFGEIADVDYVKRLKKAQPNTVLVVVSNGEERATTAYCMLRAQGVANLYILEGGLNRWLDVFDIHQTVARKRDAAPRGDESAYVFARSVGDDTPAAFPEKEEQASGDFKQGYIKKVKIQRKTAKSGGCG